MEGVERGRREAGETATAEKLDEKMWRKKDGTIH